MKILIILRWNWVYKCRNVDFLIVKRATVGRALIRRKHATRAACTVPLRCISASEMTGFSSTSIQKSQHMCRINSHTSTANTFSPLWHERSFDELLLTRHPYFSHFVSKKGHLAQICTEFIDFLRISTCRPCAWLQQRRSPKSTHLSSGAFPLNRQCTWGGRFAPKVPFNDGLRRSEQCGYLYSVDPLACTEYADAVDSAYIHRKASNHDRPDDCDDDEHRMCLHALPMMMFRTSSLFHARECASVELFVCRVLDLIYLFISIHTRVHIEGNKH